MIAAIYARKSTEQNGISDEEKSVARQVEHARAYVVRKGWTVDDSQVYVDDGISGAEFLKRPGFLRLMNTLTPRPPFQVLVMSEESRLGRESIETGWTLKKILDAGVRVFYYLEDRERTLDSALEKVMMQLSSFAAEMEREKARQRTYDAMLRKARAGQVAGGIVYGYDNVEVLSPAPDADGRRRRLHVLRRINPEQAVVLRRIFELAARGEGLSRIAKLLNEEAVPPPRSQRTKLRRGAWMPSGVREMLYRDLYRGVAVWNKTQRIDRKGTRKKRERPPSEWLSVDAPELRIIPAELWKAAHEQLEQKSAAYIRLARGRLLGRPAGTLESPYLLTGFGDCGACGGGIHVRKRTQRGREWIYYGCMRHHLGGHHACENGLMVPMLPTDQVVLEGFERDVLRPELAARMLRRAVELELQSPEVLEARRRGLEVELRRVEDELGRLTAAIAGGAALASVLEALKQRERRRGELQAQLEHLDGLARSAAGGGLKDLTRDLEARLTDWQALLHRQPVQARQILRKLLEGKLVFTPRRDATGAWYEITGQASYGRLLAGIACPRSVVPPG